MANEQRGEFAIVLAGRTYSMRPTYEAIQRFEGIDGLMLLEMAKAASAGRLSTGACAVIVAECVRAWGKAEEDLVARAFQAEAVGPLIISHGIVDVQERLTPMLVLAATGGIDAEGKRKAAPKSPKTTATAVSAESPAQCSGGRRPLSGPRPR